MEGGGDGEGEQEHLQESQFQVAVDLGLERDLYVEIQVQPEPEGVALAAAAVPLVERATGHAAQRVGYAARHALHRAADVADAAEAVERSALLPALHLAVLLLALRLDLLVLLVVRLAFRLVHLLLLLLAGTLLLRTATAGCRHGDGVVIEGRQWCRVDVDFLSGSKIVLGGGFGMSNEAIPSSFSRGETIRLSDPKQDSLLAGTATPMKS